MGRKCSMNKIREKYENLVVEYKQKIPFWRHRCRWKGKSNIRRKSVDGIQLVQNKAQGWRL
jgi:hypothetical protein